MTNRKEKIEEIVAGFIALKRKIMADGHHTELKGQITASQCQLLFLLKKNSGLGIKEIADHLGVSSSAATQLVDGLVEDGYLFREDSLSDRRAIIINLSTKSKDQIKAIHGKMLAKLSSIFETLSDKELETYGKLNKKILGE